MARIFSILTSGVLAASLLAACSPATTIQSSEPATGTGKNGDTPTSPPQSFARFPDMPVPAGAKLDLEKTIVFGSGESWFGRIAMTVSFTADQMFDFFKQELPGFDWQEITSVRSSTSVLTYQRKDRIATIQLSGRTLQGTEILITVSPKGSPASVPAPRPKG